MVFSTLNQSFSFHSSPESFISTRLQDLPISDPELLPSGASENKVITASILNRKVHIVSSYHLCKDILAASSSARSSSLAPRTFRPASASTIVSEGGGDAGAGGGGEGKASSLPDDTFVAGPAYDQLLSDFFPLPNILLEDGPAHAMHKETWMDQLSTFPSDITPRVRAIAKKHVKSLLEPTTAGSRLSDGKIDLYEALKSLAWEVLLDVFLDISPSSSPTTTTTNSSSSSTTSTNTSSDAFSTIESLQETLLRGQFSLFPVSIHAPGVWQSPRSKGIKARRDLQGKLGEIINRQDASACPYLQRGKVSREDAASHALLFTSSIAVKALASLLTAFVLNLFLWRGAEGDRHGHGDSYEQRLDGRMSKSTPTSLAKLIRSQGADAATKRRMLQSILLETERLSPPVIGVMRRVKHDIVLFTTTDAANSQTESHYPAQAATTSSESRRAAPPPAPATESTPPNSNSNPHPVPAGTDIWLYLPAASRDRTVFGDDADNFRWDRYTSSSPPSSSIPSTTTKNTTTDPNDSTTTTTTDPSTPASPLAYGTGPKSCLGTALVRQIATAVGEVLVDDDDNDDGGIEMSGEVLDLGVRAWLGWGEVGNRKGNRSANAVGAEEVARGMKQLPVQRPREVIGVAVEVSCAAVAVRPEG
jgi:cytochrome P450